MGYPIKSDIIKIIMNNLDNIPKLEHFDFFIELEKISHKLYLNFIKKVLSMKNLNYIRINICLKNNKDGPHFLSEKELRDLFPKIKFPKKLSHVKINSLNSSDCLII